MKNSIIFLTLWFFSACKQECDEATNSDSCNLDSLVVIDSFSPDLERFITRTGFSYYAHAIKSVPAGSIEWIGNSIIVNRNKYIVEFLNYRDTTEWRQKTIYDYQCERIALYVDPFACGKYEIVDKDTWKLNNQARLGLYGRSLDGGAY